MRWATTPRPWSTPSPRSWPTSRTCGSRSPPGSPRSPSARCPTPTSPTRAPAVPCRCSASKPMTKPSRLARFGFADNGARAADLLGPKGLRLWDAESQGPTGGDAAEVIQALSRAADPNLALRQLHRMVEAAGRAAARGNGGRVTGPGGEIVANEATDALLDALHHDHG